MPVPDLPLENLLGSATTIELDLWNNKTGSKYGGACVKAVWLSRRTLASDIRITESAGRKTASWSRCFRRKYRSLDADGLPRAKAEG